MNTIRPELEQAAGRQLLRAGIVLEDGARYESSIIKEKCVRTLHVASSGDGLYLPVMTMDVRSAFFHEYTFLKKYSRTDQSLDVAKVFAGTVAGNV